MATAQSKKALREYRKKHGLCIYCGVLAEPNRTMCKVCSTKAKANAKKYSERNAAHGLCKNAGCKNPVGKGKKYCTECNKKSGKRTAARRQRRVINGMCGQCGIAASGFNNSTKCEACYIKMKRTIQKLYSKRIAEGKCKNCGLYVLEKGYKTCIFCINEGRRRHRLLKIETVNAYGGAICNGCGETELSVLQIDHINGGGNKHAKEIGGRNKLYLWLKKNNFPEGFRVLCANCNVKAYRGIPLPLEQYIPPEYHI